MQFNSISSEQTIFQKFMNFDFILLFCILLLGIIRSFAMYSTDGGELLFHSKSHIYKFLIFFPMMIIYHFLILDFGIILLMYFM